MKNIIKTTCSIYTSLVRSNPRELSGLVEGMHKSSGNSNFQKFWGKGQFKRNRNFVQNFLVLSKISNYIDIFLENHTSFGFKEKSVGWVVRKVKKSFMHLATTSHLLTMHGLE